MRDLLFSNRFNALEFFCVLLAIDIIGGGFWGALGAACIGLLSALLLETTYKTIWGAK